MEMLKSQEKDSVRLGLYPSLDYKGLYNAIVQLTDVVPLIQYGLNGLYSNSSMYSFMFSSQKSHWTFFVFIYSFLMNLFISLSVSSKLQYCF
jgi:hypothetical protein